MLQRLVPFFYTLLSLMLLLTTASHANEALIPVDKARQAPLTNIALPTHGNSDIKIEDFSGQVVLVDFWASWCEPCRDSFPWMNQIQDKYADQGLVIIAINLDEDRKLAEQFLQQVPAQFIVAFDKQKQLPMEYGLVGMPSSYLLDRDGRIRSGYIGFYNNHTERYEEIIRALLKNL